MTDCVSAACVSVVVCCCSSVDLACLCMHLLRPRFSLPLACSLSIHALISRVLSFSSCCLAGSYRFCYLCITLCFFLSQSMACWKARRFASCSAFFVLLPFPSFLLFRFTSSLGPFFSSRVEEVHRTHHARHSSRLFSRWTIFHFIISS